MTRDRRVVFSSGSGAARGKPRRDKRPGIKQVEKATKKGTDGWENSQGVGILKKKKKKEEEERTPSAFGEGEGTSKSVLQRSLPAIGRRSFVN